MTQTKEVVEDSPKVLYKKAKFLEETLEKMQKHSDYLYRKIGYLNKREKGKGTQELREKLKDINKGIYEVSDKANVLWKLIGRLDRESKGHNEVNYLKEKP